MFEGMTRGRYDTGEVEIAYTTGGSGPPVLLLHGFPQTSAMWARIGPRLARRFTVVAADLRGYGDSGKPVCAEDCANYSFRAMACDQVALMRHLGFQSFHVIGHDRGGRAAHRLALDAPAAVRSLAVLDIVPTHAMIQETSWQVAKAYWHWYFLAQPAPFPEHLIGSDPDFFYETCLTGWGKMALSAFDAAMLAEYRRCWRNPAAIHGSCADYRAAFAQDIVHDAADLDVKVACPTLVFWGTAGLMHQLYDMEAEWKKRIRNLRTATLPGGHFFPDQFPEETAAILMQHLDGT